jgi:hypothetical protein
MSGFNRGGEKPALPLKNSPFPCYNRDRILTFGKTADTESGIPGTISDVFPERKFFHGYY